MTPETWRRVEAIFLEAVSLPAEDRAAVVDRACGDDAEVRRAVRSLLAADREDEDALADAVGGGLALLDATRDREPGRRLGSWRLLRRLGYGGMGEVHLAERVDQEFTKKAAVKLIRPGLDSGRILERFRRERQILANLEHPNIAHLLDGGTTAEGMPYFVMEYVEGEPIDRWCDARRLDVRERLELFRTVCAAVQFAHESLVVHRDLKPSNILVTPNGVVKLLDFGIAKLLRPDETGISAVDMTRTGERPLTLGYASPEQVRGAPVTTASDVYALGCLLHLLLVGERPFEIAGKPRREAEALILEQVPLAPSARVRDEAKGLAAARRTRTESLRRRLRGDLDTIVLMALRKEPRRRYGSAGALGEDVGRHLDGLPVRAHRDSLGYRGTKFVRRHRVGLAVALVLVSASVWTLAERVRHASRLERERDRAQQVTRFLTEIFDAADPRRAGGPDVTAIELLASAEARLGRLDDQPLEQAAVADTLGRVYRELGMYAEAEPLAETSLRLRRALLGPDDPDVAASLNSQGLLWQQQRRWSEAEEAHRRALAIYRLYPRAYRAELAEVTNDLALAISGQARYPEATVLLRDALGRYRALHGEDHETVAACRANLGLVLLQAGDPAHLPEARVAIEQALAVARRRLGDDDPRVGQYLNNLGVVLQVSGEADAARQRYEEALEIRLNVLGDAHPDVVETWINLASLANEAGDYPRAEVAAAQAVTVGRRALGPDHPDLAQSLLVLGLVRVNRGLWDDAVLALDEALAIRRGQGGPPDRVLAEILGNAGVAESGRRRYPEAEARYAEALSVLERLDEATPIEMSLMLLRLGQLDRVRQMPEAAVARFQRAVTIRVEHHGAASTEVASARVYLGDALEAAGHIQRAEAVYRAAIRSLELAGTQPRRLASAWTGLGSALLRREAWTEAETALRKAESLHEARLQGADGRRDRELARTRSALGACLAARGRTGEAAELLRDSLDVLSEALGPDHPSTRAARERLDAFLGLSPAPAPRPAPEARG